MRSIQSEHEQSSRRTNHRRGARKPSLQPSRAGRDNAAGSRRLRLTSARRGRRISNPRDGAPTRRGLDAGRLARRVIILILTLPIITLTTILTTTTTTLHQLKVSTSQTLAIRQVDNHTAAAKEALAVLGRGRKQVEVGCLERVLARRDLAVLAAQVADLALLGGVGVAGRGVAALVGVQVAQRAGAVAVGRDGGFVEVVGWGGAVS